MHYTTVVQFILLMALSDQSERRVAVQESASSSTQINTKNGEVQVVNHYCYQSV